MFRIIIRLLLFIVISGGSVLLIAQWRLDDSIKELKENLKPLMEIAYKSASINYRGMIKIKGISVYIDAIKSQLDIGEINLFAGNLYQLTMLQSNLNKNKLPENAFVKIINVTFPTDNPVIKQLQNTTPLNGYDILQSAYCGRVNRFTLDELAGMGYHYFSLSSEYFYRLDHKTGDAVITGSVDIEDFNRNDFQIVIGGVLNWMEAMAQPGAAQDADQPLPELSLISLKVQDKGLNLRRAEYCNELQDSSTDYYTGHVDALAEMFAKLGVTLADDFKKLYAESLQPDSLVVFNIEPEVNFELSYLMTQDYLQLIDSLGIRVLVNDKPLNLSIANLTFDKLGKLIQFANKAVQVEAVDKPKYQFVTVRQEFVTTQVRDISRYVDYRVKVMRGDGQVFDGKLIRVSGDKCWVKVHSKAGTVSYPIAISRITELQVFREVSRD